MENTQESNKLSVSVILGLVGAGKTTVLKHISKENKKVKIMVNDIEELRTENKETIESKHIRVDDGCLCCSSRDNLTSEVAEIAKEGDCNNLVIEATGIAEPLSIAEMFSLE